MPEPFKEPNANMKVLRKRRGMTQEAVAEKAEITQQHYSLIERGIVSPTMRTALKIARALGAEMSEVWP